MPIPFKADLLDSQGTYPHLLLYWGRKGGGFRLTNELIGSVSKAGFKKVFVSVREDVYKQLSVTHSEVMLENLPAFDNNSRKQFLLGLFTLRNRRIVQKLVVKCKEKGIKSLVVIMASPGDLCLSKYTRSTVTVTRVIHDLRRHPGEFWPNRITTKKMLKADKVITLSSFVFERVNHGCKFLSSLSREIGYIHRTPIEGIPSDFILIAGRLKKYKNLEITLEVIKRFPEHKFVIAGVGSKKFLSLENCHVIDRWLSDAELEFLISECQGLIAIYSEVSQSGIVDQALYWRKPVLVSDVGALTEQVSYSQLGLICNHKSLTDVESGLIKLLNINPIQVPTQDVKTTLYHTLLEI